MEEREQMNIPLRDLIEIIRFTEKVSAKIHGLLDEAEIYRTVKREFAKSKRYNASIFLLTDDGSKLRFAETSLSPEKVKAGERAAGFGSYKNYRVDLDKSSFFSQVVREGKTIEANFIDAIGELFPRPLAHLITKIIGYEKRSGILTPLKRHGKIMGVLFMDSTELAEHFIPSVGNLAQHISTALELADEHAERKRTEEALRRSEEQARCLLEFRNKVIDTAVVWIDLLDAEGNITLWNRAAELISGYSREEVIGHKKAWEWLYPDPKYRAKIFDDAKRVIERGERVDIDETTIRCKDGTLKTISWYSNSILDDKGKPVGLVSVGLDITEIIRVQEKVRESEEKYRNLFESAGDGILTFDLRGRITSVNKKIEEISGFSQEEIIGKHFTHFARMGIISLKDIPWILKAFSRRIKGEPTKVYEVKIRNKKGQEKFIEFRGSLIKQRGKPIEVLEIIRDVTERKTIEEKLRESEERFKNLYESIRDPVGVFVGREGRLIDYNKAFKRLSGYADEELKDKTFLDFVHLDDQAMVLKKYRTKYPEEELPLVYEIRGVNKKGEIIPLEISVSTYKVKDKVVGIEVIHRDITERKAMERKLQEYAEHLQEMVEERTRELKEAQEQLLKSERLAAIGELAAMVGHDLRNPLQAITNAVYVLKSSAIIVDDLLPEPTFSKIRERITKLVEERNEMVRVIDESIKYANKIVSDLRDLARTKEPEPIEVDLESLIQKTLSDISIPDNVRVSIRHDQALCELYIDPTQIRRVFTNLTTNAIQAMPNGGELTISTSLKDGFASIAFQDTGVGIPKEDTRKLFTSLFTTKSKGVGLGLVICKNIVEAHGGSIEVESQEGKGSTFTVKLPVKKGDETSGEEGKHLDRG